MNIALLNTFFPPDSAITGISLAEIVPRLQQRFPEAAIRVYSADASYHGDTPVSRKTRPSVMRSALAFRGRGKLGRLIWSLVLGRRMAKQAVGWADVILSLTDPPLLGFWIGRERSRSRRSIRWIEWTMDLYPEAFASASLVGAGNPIYRHIQISLRSHAPDGWICLGERQAKAVASWRGVSRPSVILPCGICDPAGPLEGAPEWRRNEPRVVIAYAGNLGEAHCPDLLPALVEAADPDLTAFRFALYGAHAAATRTRLEGRRNVAWCDTMSRADLAAADVQVASLLPCWTHVCVPSKAVTGICVGRPLIFAGSADSDTAEMLGDAAWVLRIPDNGRYDRAAIGKVMRDVQNPQKLEEKRRKARETSRRLGEMKESAFGEAVDLIGGITRHVVGVSQGTRDENAIESALSGDWSP